MWRCGNCGTTDIDDLDPQDNGSLYCGRCDRVTRPPERTPTPVEPRRRRDTDE